MVSSLSAQAACLGKIKFLSDGPKTSRSIRMQDSLINYISQTRWFMESNFRQQRYSVISTENDQERLGMAEGMPNSESALS